MTGVAAGHTTGLHELAMLMSLTSRPCERWQELGFGRSALLYRRTQVILEAARLLPAHRRLPRVSFLNGLWWKLLSVQPARILIGNSTSAEGLYSPREFHVEGFSAGSYTGAVIVLALRALFPDCRTSAKLGAIAMPKGVVAALLDVANLAHVTSISFMRKMTLCATGSQAKWTDMSYRTGSRTPLWRSLINGWALISITPTTLRTRKAGQSVFCHLRRQNGRHDCKLPASPLMT